MLLRNPTGVVLPFPENLTQAITELSVILPLDPFEVALLSSIPEDSPLDVTLDIILGLVDNVLKEVWQHTWSPTPHTHLPDPTAVYIMRKSLRKDGTFKDISSVPPLLAKLKHLIRIHILRTVTECEDNTPNVDQVQQWYHANERSSFSLLCDWQHHASAIVFGTQKLPNIVWVPYVRCHVSSLSVSTPDAQEYRFQNTSLQRRGDQPRPCQDDAPGH